MESTRNTGNSLEALELEEPCLLCAGTGSERAEDGLVRCCMCAGSGYSPTPFGEKIIRLLRHQIHVVLRDAAGD